MDSSRVCSLKPAYGYHCNQENLETCQRYGNPNYGFTSFDNFAWSQLTVFQLLTVEGWTDGMTIPLLLLLDAITLTPFFSSIISRTQICTTRKTELSQQSHGSTSSSLWSLGPSSCSTLSLQCCATKLENRYQ